MFNEIMTWCQTFLGIIPGTIGHRLRPILLCVFAKNIGKKVKIKNYVYIWDINKLEIGDRSTIGTFAQINCIGHISIGRDVMIGPFCMLTSANHGYKDQKIPMNRQKLVTKPIRIGNNVWIGGHVTILPGVTIQDDCIIGAGSTVTKSFGPGQLIAGVPAKPIKKIGKQSANIC
jgi:maltose O-acetyltransferase